MLKLLRFLADKSPFTAETPHRVGSEATDTRSARDSELAAMPSTFAPMPPTEVPIADGSPWSKFRSHEPHALAESSFAWALDLPRDVRPTQLLVRYPRVANRLAVAWTDASLTDRVFDSLARNTREGRRGFPPHVAEELRVLAALHDSTRKSPARNRPSTAPLVRATPFPAPAPAAPAAVPLKPAYDDAWAAQATSDR